MQVARPSLSSSFPAGSPPQAHTPAAAAAAMYPNPPHANMAAPASFNRSFSDLNGFPQHALEKPQIYTVRPAALPSNLPMLTQ